MRSKQTFPQAVAQSAATRALYIDGAQRNTVWSLFVTLSFIAAGTAASLASQLSHPGIFITLLGLFSLWYASSRVTRRTGMEDDAGGVGAWPETGAASRSPASKAVSYTHLTLPTKRIV